MTLKRDVSPTDGFKPTTPLNCAGEMMLPSVSVPIVATASARSAATPDPLLEPLGSKSAL